MCTLTHNTHTYTLTHIFILTYIHTHADSHTFTLTHTHLYTLAHTCSHCEMYVTANL